ncbi:MAG: tetratricopeptide repeat protein [Thermoguttaceae bacterium]|jgi:tetratricopeptide (TPR) repeat protein
MSKRKRSSDKDARRALTATSVSSALPLSAMVGVAVVILAVFIAYQTSIKGGFVLDDDNLMTENPLVKTLDGLHRFWCSTEAQEFYPVSNTTFWLEWRLWERNPVGYHVTNLILHIVDVLLIWVILRKLSIPGAFFAAIIFAVHPVNVESVAWIAQVRNMLAMTFLLLSILWYLKANAYASAGFAPARPRAGSWEREQTFSSFIIHPSSFLFWYLLSLAAFVLAMLSKGSTAVLPGLVLGIIWWLRPLTWRDLARIAPFLVIAGALAWVSVWFQTRGENLVFRSAGFTERLLRAGLVPWFYLYEALFPVDLYFVYPMWHIRIGSILWWLPLAASLAVTATLWWCRKGWGRPLLFTWGFFCVALLPVVGFTDVGFMRYSLVADHYQHIAIIGVCALPAAGWGIWRRCRGRIGWTQLTAAILAVGSLAFLTWRQNEIYTDEITLYHAALKKNPDCCMVHNNLGYLVAIRGNSQKETDEAIYHFQQAVNLNPQYAEAHNNLGNLLSNAGRTKEGEEHLRQALRLKPNYLEAYRNLGDLFLRSGRFQEASESYQQVLRLKPDFVEVYLSLAWAYVNLQRSYDAITAAQKAEEIARSQGRTEIAQKIGEWLKSYRAGQTVSPNATPPSK